MKIYPRRSFAPGRVQTAIACGFLAALLAAHPPVVDAQQADATVAPPLVVFAETEARADQAPRALSLALPSASDACTDSTQTEVVFTDIEVEYNEENLVSLYARDDTKDSEVSLVIQG